MSENTITSPFTGRWFPVPVQALFDLMKVKKHQTVIVWLAMLSEAHLDHRWRTSSTINAVAEITGFSANTVQKCRRELIDAGLVRVISGGGGTRKKVIFAVTRFANFHGKSGHFEQNGTPPKKPVGNWNL